LEVIGIDPALASLEVARAKPGSDRVTWIQGYASDLPPLDADLAMMTGNVAQAIIDPDEWKGTLLGIHAALSAGGRMVFETRDPAAGGWEEWTRDASHGATEVDGVGTVESWVELTEVALPLVSFRRTYVFPGGDVLTSDSTLRFRERPEVVADLAAAGYRLEEMRDAPDRPGRELVFIARRS
jgi:hypothetical protein